MREKIPTDANMSVTVVSTLLGIPTLNQETHGESLVGGSATRMRTFVLFKSVASQFRFMLPSLQKDWFLDGYLSLVYRCSVSFYLVDKDG